MFRTSDTSTDVRKAFYIEREIFVTKKSLKVQDSSASIIQQKTSQSGYRCYWTRYLDHYDDYCNNNNNIKIFNFLWRCLNHYDDYEVP
ncbi:Hypothetical predicted protein [Pelobates cultripes]|uniref:Uncharacterized protein n=1 Tax=Pelobates cultripes TaxID=61616 RepID=A0AAD1S7A7_PELCU|nr:Hypothetical predicted protein [Pelobates cultripes]